MKTMPPLLFLGLCLLSTAVVQAQGRPGLKLGIGLSMASAAYDRSNIITASAQSKTGAVAQAFLSVPLRKGWRFEPGVQWTVKGLKETVRYQYSGNLESYYTRTENIDYIEVPLMLVHHSQADAGFQYGVGPVPAFVLHKAYSRAKPFDFGVQALAGYATKLGFQFQLAYTHGLPNVERNQDLPLGFTTSLRNRFAAFTVGYLF